DHHATGPPQQIPELEYARDRVLEEALLVHHLLAVKRPALGEERALGELAQPRAGAVGVEGLQVMPRRGLVGRRERQPREVGAAARCVARVPGPGSRAPRSPGAADARARASRSSPARRSPAPRPVPWRWSDPGTPGSGGTRGARARRRARSAPPRPGSCAAARASPRPRTPGPRG